jgi:hypothetical protein
MAKYETVKSARSVDLSKEGQPNLSTRHLGTQPFRGFLTRGWARDSAERAARLDRQMQLNQRP